MCIQSAASTPRGSLWCLPGKNLPRLQRVCRDNSFENSRNRRLDTRRSFDVSWPGQFLWRDARKESRKRVTITRRPMSGLGANRETKTPRQRYPRKSCQSEAILVGEQGNTGRVEKFEIESRFVCRPVDRIFTKKEITRNPYSIFPRIVGQKSN